VGHFRLDFRLKDSRQRIGLHLIKLDSLKLTRLKNSYCRLHSNSYSSNFGRISTKLSAQKWWNFAWNGRISPKSAKNPPVLGKNLGQFLGRNRVEIRQKLME
jgi:hypothetical protein